MENEELDLVVFEDDKGNEIKMEVLDYLFYEGKEYALLTEYDETEACQSCEEKACDGCEKAREAFVMEVVPVDDDMEEFVPVDEALGEKIFDIFENSDFDEEEFSAGNDERTFMAHL